MPWVEELPNGKFKAWWRDDLGKRKSKSPFTQSARALRYAGEQESRSRRGEITTAGRSPTWDDWCVEWLRLRQVARSTERNDKARIANYIRPKWGKARIAKIDREHVQIWVNDMIREGMTPELVRRVYYTFSASMKAAMLARRIQITPCSFIELPDLADSHERYFTRGEFDAANALMSEPYRSAAIVLVGTGQRFGELAALHWNRINFVTGFITVIDSYDPVDGVIKLPKNNKSRQVGPLPSWVLDALLARRELLGDKRVHTGCGIRHGASKKPCRSGLVFSQRNGKPLDDKNMLRRHWKPAQERAGIEPPGRVHDLRHTYASWLVQAGIPLEEVQRLLGHASIVTTQRYTHHGDTQNAAILRALEGQGGKLLKLAPSLPLRADPDEAAGAL